MNHTPSVERLTATQPAAAGMGALTPAFISGAAALALPKHAAEALDHSGPWYVCLTKPRQEAYAALKLQEQGFQVYLPELETWSRLGGDWRKKKSVMFPRYAFVRPSTPHQGVGPVRSTPGVTSMVRFGPVLATLAPVRLLALQQAVQLRSQTMPRQPFVAGQHVLFAAGPLAGLEGIVSSVAAERVTVLMQLLGQAHLVPVPFQDLKPVL